MKNIHQLSLNKLTIKQKKTKEPFKTEKFEDLEKSINNFIFLNNNEDLICKEDELEIKRRCFNDEHTEKKNSLIFLNEKEFREKKVKEKLYSYIEEFGLKLYMNVLEEYIKNESKQINIIENTILKYKQRLISTLLNKRNSNKFMSSPLKYESLQRKLDSNLIKNNFEYKQENNFGQINFQNSKSLIKSEKNSFQTASQINYNLEEHLLKIWTEEKIKKSNFEGSSLKEKQILWILVNSQFNIPKIYKKILTKSPNPPKSELKLINNRTHYKLFYCKIIYIFVNRQWGPKRKNETSMDILEERANKILSHAKKLRLSSKLQVKLKHSFVKCFAKIHKSLYYNNYEYLDLMIKVLKYSPGLKDDFINFKEEYLKDNKYSKSYEKILLDYFKKVEYDINIGIQKNILPKFGINFKKEGKRYLSSLNIPLPISNTLSIFKRIEQIILK